MRIIRKKKIIYKYNNILIYNMVLYTCQNCLKEFKKKDDYTKHTLKRKNPCRPINIKYLALPLKCSQDTHKNTLINQNVLIMIQIVIYKMI